MFKFSQLHYTHLESKFVNNKKTTITRADTEYFERKIWNLTVINLKEKYKETQPIL